jgi:hypothetical protein
MSNARGDDGSPKDEPEAETLNLLDFIRAAPDFDQLDLQRNPGVDDRLKDSLEDLDASRAISLDDPANE